MLESRTVVVNIKLYWGSLLIIFVINVKEAVVYIAHQKQQN